MFAGGYPPRLRKTVSYRSGRPSIHTQNRLRINATDASDKRLLLTENYTQPFNTGVLGKVYRTGEPLRVEDTSKRARQGYIRIMPDARSCLSYPVKLDGAVEWILDCESTEVGAFQRPDEVELGALIREAQKTIALWFEMRLNRALIENIDQGVIVVDQANRITPAKHAGRPAARHQAKHPDRHRKRLGLSEWRSRLARTRQAP